jgi:outer membrane receptor protein involved in Fe transport
LLALQQFVYALGKTLVMGRASIAASIVAAAFVTQIQAAPIRARSVIIAVEKNSEGVADIAVIVDGAPIGNTDQNGALRFSATPGLHRAVLNRAGAMIGFTEFRIGDDQATEILFTLPENLGEPRVEHDIYAVTNPERINVSGIVTNASGAPISGATIAVADAGTSVTTAANGAFSLQLPRGDYALTVTASGSTPQTLENVHVSPLLTQSLSISLVATATKTADKSSVTLDGVTVKGRYKRSSTAQKERLATSVVDAVTAEEIAAAGDSNASESLKRVTGLSVQDGVVVVRGLGDRYSTTLVNGAEIPSFNPSRRVVSADVFPSEFIGGLTVQKTYSADLPAEFSGGVALIETRPLPDYRTGSIQLKVGGNTQTTFSPVLTYRGSESDYLGFDGGQRALPSAYNGITNGGNVAFNALPQSQRGLLLQALPDLFDLRRIDDAPVDFGGSLSYGDVFSLGGSQKLGFQISGLYDTDFRFRRELRNDFQSVDGNAVASRDRELLQRSEQKFETGASSAIGYAFDKQNSVQLVTLLSRQTEKGAFFGRGQDFENVLDQQRVTLDYVESQLLSNQLTGKNRIDSLGNLGIKWQFGYSTADRDVLDRRTYEYVRALQSGANDAPYALALGPANEGVEPRRTFEYLSDKTLDGGVDFSLPVTLNDNFSGSFKFGFRATRRDRDFSSVRLGYQSFAGQRSDLFQAARLAPSPESILIPLFFGPGGFDLIEVNSLIAQGGNANIYSGTHDINAVYALADIFSGSTFEVQAGARLESSKIDVLTGNPNLGATLNSKLDDTDILPSLNATWFVSNQQQLRIGVSQSVNRPQFRELTPVEFLDPDTRFLTSGNPNLRSAKLTNYDLRYEHYWSSNTTSSVALFYKDIKNPIEFNIGSTSGGDAVRSFSNARSAYDYGVEFDGRYDFGGLRTIAPVLTHFYVSGNASLIKSRAQLNNGESRRLQGQSKYVANATLGYDAPTSRTNVALLFNIFGDRIAEVGFSGLPNAIEKSYPLLDFNFRQGIGRSWEFGLKVRNLLDPNIRIRQGNGIQREYQLGVSGQLSLKYQF